VSLQALDLGKILDLLDEAKTRLNLVFLDACRNNPYARSFRSGANGLAKIQAPSGTLISFATRPGSVASDGKGKNGLYTEKLLLAMNDTGQPIELVVKRVVSGVKAASNGQQEPWMEGSIEGDFCFGKCGSAFDAPHHGTASSPAALEIAFWESVRDGGGAELLAYLDKYPNGQFAGLAKNKADRIRQDLAALIAAAPKPYPSAPLTNTPSGIPMLYGPAAQALKGKTTDAQTADLLAAYRRDAEAGNAPAQFSLGSMLGTGLGVQPNSAEAYTWYRKAADQGLAVAQNNVGNAFLHGAGVTKDEPEGVKWFRLAADQGIPVAQLNLASLYYSGLGVQKDQAEGVNWMRRAAEQGLPAAENALARAYLNGSGVTKDETEGLEWLRKAAEHGEPNAAALLGAAYESGSYGLTKDQAQAVHWIRQAAEGGDASGQAMLGYAYMTGGGVERSYGEALNWCRKAAEQGNAQASNNLGYLYEHGYGVDKDRSAAIGWYRKAADKDFAIAKGNLRRLGVE
jgi:TPR repeat protein